MISISDLRLYFGGQRIFDGVNWQVAASERVGLVGANGSGKTTLMRLILGEFSADGGAIVMPKAARVAYLPQGGVSHQGNTLLEEVSSVLPASADLRREEQDLLKRLGELDAASEEYAVVTRRWSDVHERIVMHGGYQIEQQVERVLIGLGFAHADLSRACGEFSGGWQMRIALGKVLLADPDIMLLDEPTNYLDIEAREFLEQHLRSFKGSVVLVSHDRYFLDQVVSRITELHDGKLTDYAGTYSQYEEERDRRVELLLKKSEELREERERIQHFVDRFRYQAAKAAAVQSRIKQLEKMEQIELPTVRRRIHFNFPQPARSGRIALTVEGLHAGYGEGPDILKGIDFALPRGEKVALTGVNGAGKTTLIKVLAGLLKPRGGSYTLGHNIDLDFFAQDAHRSLDDRLTVFQTLERSCPFELTSQLRNLLGAFLFSGDEVEKRVGVLSGGERNRLALARMLLRPSNLLLMDEPTNHLDLDAKEVLLTALKRFDGTVLFVSHDRYFLDQLSTRVLSLNEGGLYEYPGTYPEFLHHMKSRSEHNEFTVSSQGQTTATAAVVAAAPALGGVDFKEDKKKRWQEQKERKREVERLQRQVNELETDISRHEDALAALDRQMSEPGAAADFARLAALTKKKAELEDALRDRSRRWEEAASKLEAARGANQE